MATYTKIHRSIWNDADFRALSDDGKLVFLYVLTHPSQTSIGAFRGSFAGLAAELGWPDERFAKGFKEPFAAGMVKHDPSGPMVWAVNWLRYHKPDNPNMVQAWAGCLDLLPECDLKIEVLKALDELVATLPGGFRERFSKQFPNGLANGMANKKKEKEKEKKKEKEKESSKATPLRGGQDPPAAGKGPTTKVNGTPKGAQTWAAYAYAFLARYGTEPVRNARVNALIGQVVDRLGAEEAPQVAAFYVGHNGAFYVQKGHPVGLLVSDAEKLRTEWATGRTVSATQARQIENAGSNLSAFMRLQPTKGH